MFAFISDLSVSIVLDRHQVLVKCSVKSAFVGLAKSTLLYSIIVIIFCVFTMMHRLS